MSLIRFLYLHFWIAGFQCSQFLMRLLKEGAVLCRFGVERAVVQRCLYWLPLAQECFSFVAEERVGEAFPDVVDGLLRGVQHVGRIEAIVAKLVAHYLVRRKVDAGVSLPSHFVCRQQQRSFRYGAAVKAVLGVAYRTHGEHDAHVRPALAQHVYGFRYVFRTLVDAEAALGEESLRSFLAAVHYLARLVEYVHAVGAEREHRRARHLRSLGCEVALHGVQYARRVVHHAVRIDRSAKFVVDESAADVVGEARTHEEHTLAGGYRERRLVYGDWRAEFHYSYSFFLFISKTTPPMMARASSR